jgi:PAS domain S-box-containing protein
VVSPYAHLSRDERLRLLDSRERRDSSSRAAKAFAKEAEQYRNVVEQAADGIFILDKQGRFLEVNESGARMLGRTRQGLVGRRVRELVMPEDLPKHLADWKALRKGKPFIGERRLRRKDGSAFSVEVSAKRLSDGRFEGIALWNRMSVLFTMLAWCFMFCRADAFRDIGGFSLDLFATEEVKFGGDLKLWARARGLRVVILRRVPLVTSGRKFGLYTKREWGRFLWAFVKAPRLAIRERHELHYGGRR